MMSVCPNCGTELEGEAKYCASCGYEISPSAINQERDQEYNPNNDAIEPEVVATPVNMAKDRMVAGIFAILLGTFGIHKFYLNDMGMGLLYLIFSWTGIPSIVGLIEGILYLTATDEEFQERFVKN